MYSLPLLYSGKCVATLREAFFVRLSMGRTFLFGGCIMESKKYTPIYLAYNCSACGKLVKKKQIIQETVYVSDKDSIVWEGDSGNASGTKPIEHGRKIKKILNEAERNCYRTAEFNCSCDACNHKEPWSKMRYNLFDVIAGCILPFGILLSFVAWQVGLVLLGIVGAYLGVKCLHRRYCEEKIKALPKHSLPIISIDLDELEEKIELNTTVRHNI